MICRMSSAALRTCSTARSGSASIVFVVVLLKLGMGMVGDGEAVLVANTYLTSIDS